MMPPPECPSCRAPVRWLDETCATCGCEIEVDAFASAMHAIDADIEAEEVEAQQFTLF